MTAWTRAEASGRRSVNGLQSRIEQEVGLDFRSRPAAIAVDALPLHLKRAIEQDDCLRAAATRTSDVVFIENLADGNSSSHS